jgi:hypothetical protein
LDFFGEFDCFLLGDDDNFFFIGDPTLLFFDEGLLDDFELLDVFLADAMIG